MKKKYPIHDCDICFKENEEIFGDCCGVKACIECDSKLHGLCSICEKDELNDIYECDNCWDDATLMYFHMCKICEEMYCDDCLSINEPPIFVCLKDKCEEAYYKDFEEYCSVRLIQDVWRNYFFEKYILD